MKTTMKNEITGHSGHFRTIIIQNIYRYIYIFDVVKAKNDFHGT